LTRPVPGSDPGDAPFRGLTPELLERLGGAHIDAHARTAIVLCTIGEDGFPHPAMLSYFEVAATGAHTLRLAVYKDSRTLRNMRDRGKATLILADERLACYIRAAVQDVTPAMASAPYNARVDLRVEQVTFDAPPPDLEPGAFLTTGITYAARTGPALERARQVLAELLRM
jgi:hypothetical protein